MMFIFAQQSSGFDLVIYLGKHKGFHSFSAAPLSQTHTQFFFSLFFSFNTDEKIFSNFFQYVSSVFSLYSPNFHS